MDSPNERLDSAIRKTQKFQAFLLLSLIFAVALINMLYFVYKYLFNTAIQYIFLFFVLLFLSGAIIIGAFGRLELNVGENTEQKKEGHVKRMARRMHLASQGYTFTQDLLRRRLRRIAEEEGVVLKEKEIVCFLDTPIEGQKRSFLEGERYMKKLTDVITALEERT